MFTLSPLLIFDDQFWALGRARQQGLNTYMAWIEDLISLNGKKSRAHYSEIERPRVQFEIFVVDVSRATHLCVRTGVMPARRPVVQVDLVREAHTYLSER